MVATTATTLNLITHVATLFANEPEADLENNSASLTTTVTPLADLQVQVEGPRQPTLVGQPLVYTVTLTNQGPSTANGISLVDVLPGGVSFVSASDNAGRILTVRDGVVIDQISSLPSGGVVVLTIIVRPTLDSVATPLKNARTSQAWLPTPIPRTTPQRSRPRSYPPRTSPSALRPTRTPRLWERATH